MKTHADKTGDNKSQAVANSLPKTESKGESALQFTDNRPETVAQRKLQEMANNSPAVMQLKAVQQMADHFLQGQQVHQLLQSATLPVVQRVTKKGPDGNNIEVTKVEDYLPNCLGDPEDFSNDPRTMYRRNGGIENGWNDTDLFYTSTDEGDLIQITTAMVNAYWDPKYPGFAKLSGPDWIVNCEDYAKADGFGAKLGDYDSKERLIELLPAVGNYVLQLSWHWMRVLKTGDDAITIRQKDGESAVYAKDYDVSDACDYILEKHSMGGTVYRG